MKKLSLLSSILFLLLLVGLYAAFYNLGWVTNGGWAVSYWIFGLPVLFLLLLTSLVTWICSLLKRKDRIWTTGTLLLTGLLFQLPNVLHVSTVQMLLHGLVNHVTHDYTLNDLRHFARDMHNAIGDNYISHGSLSDLNAQQAEDYKKLQVIYPLTTWSMTAGEGPSIGERFGIMTVDWGGALSGHWGFSVALDGKHIDPPSIPQNSIRTQIVRVSDDIYFFYGE